MNEQIDGTDAQAAAEILSEIAAAPAPVDKIEDDSDEDSVAISDLESAIETVMTQIKSHEAKIEDLAEDIRGHKTQIENLRESLRKIVGPILGRSLTPKPEPTRSSSRTDDSTGNLIIECMRKSKSPMDTKTIKAYLENRGNKTQPSVELCRMVKRGILIRAGRGRYKLK